MTMAEALATVRYVLDTNGEKTDVILPLTVWEAFLASWEYSPASDPYFASFTTGTSSK